MNFSECVDVDVHCLAVDEADGGGFFFFLKLFDDAQLVLSLRRVTASLRVRSILSKKPLLSLERNSAWSCLQLSFLSLSSRSSTSGSYF